MLDDNTQELILVLVIPQSSVRSVFNTHLSD